MGRRDLFLKSYSFGGIARDLEMTHKNQRKLCSLEKACYSYLHISDSESRLVFALTNLFDLFVAHADNHYYYYLFQINSPILEIWSLVKHVLEN